jgi:RNA polymerase sigma-70 factor (ECF subfamily)
LTTGDDPRGDKGDKVLSAPLAHPWTAGASNAPPARLAFASLYDEHFDFVYRTVRRLGIAESAAEDVTQEVFVRVHKSLFAFEGRSSLRTWLFGIARNVAYHHRRALGRRIATTSGEGGGGALESAHDDDATSAQDLAERREAARVLDALLASMDDEKREVFMLVELEEMSMPEVAEALGINVNTAYTRLRAARQQFEGALARHRAKSAWTGRKETP